MEKKTKLRVIREQKGLSIFELSKLSGVSFEKVRQLDSGYRVERTSDEIKMKVVNALGKNIVDVFPDVKKKRIQHMNEMSKGQKLLLVIKDYLSDLKLSEEEEILWERTLGQMSQEEVGLYIMHSGQDKKTCRKNIEKFIKKYKKTCS